MTQFLCFKNGMPCHQVDVHDRAFQYGDGCFTTARVVNGQVDLWERHRARLISSIQALSLNLTVNELDYLYTQCHQHIFDQVQRSGILKIVISRGNGTRGYSMPESCADVYFFYYPQHGFIHQFRPIRSGVLTRCLGQSMPMLRGIKSLNRLEQILLKQEADQQLWPEAVACNVQGEVIEGVSSNCFFYLDSRWCTPDLSDYGIAGVMRAEILARFAMLGLACEIRKVHRDELLNVEAMFFCNALRPMQVVDYLNEQQLNVAQTSQLCQQLLLS